MLPPVSNLTARARSIVRTAAEQRRLSRLARAVRRRGLTYLSPRKIARIEGCLDDVTRRRVPGDFLETGVALGGSAIVIAGPPRGGRGFHGYDVFGVIPPPS